MAHTSTILAFAFVCLLLGLQPASGLPPTERTRTSTATRTSTRTHTESTNAPETETSAPASGLRAGADHQCVGRQQDLQEDLMKIKNKTEAIRCAMQNVSFNLFGRSGPKPTVGIYPGTQRSNRFPLPSSGDSGQIIAESYYFFKCFIAPVGDALKNETNRYIKPDSSYRIDFYSAIGNITVARDIYMLVKGTSSINTCDLPRKDEECTFTPQPMEGKTEREVLIGGIATELYYLAEDLLPHLRHLPV